MKILILRPEPGAGETAARARELGLEPVVAPLFTVRPLAWTPPDPSGFDAVLLTSAHTARLAGGGMTPFLERPCYTVGERTAAAAREAGFTHVREGPADGAALLQIMAAEGMRSAFHPCGREHLTWHDADVAVTSIPVYAADAIDRLPEAAREAIAVDALVLLHSPRAASLFSALVGPSRSNIRIAAISRAAAEAAGEGWHSRDHAEAPRDQALLELAAKLCQDGRV
ncbi:MAG TPA: uroporphyrinogen-III synthase [Allosphingosinicella sp.]|nr:uroporphyrinogen-III synthase [Allosphingosinicella sp.]